MNLRKTTDISRLLHHLRIVAFPLLFPVPVLVRESGSRMTLKGRFLRPVGHP